MVEIIDIKALTAHVKPIVNRGPHTTENEVEAAFASLGQGDFKDANIFFGSFDGCAGWEKHPAGEELVQIVNGATEFDIIVDDELKTLQLSSGNLIIVPKDSWHRFRSKAGVTVLTATPKGEEPHLFVDDPRQPVAPRSDRP